jgi:golgi phosphoprotein 3
MEFSVATSFIILALHPDKGRIMIDNLHFRYTLTGAVIMDFVEKGEIKFIENKIVPSFRRNGVSYHDIFAEKIENSGRNRKISHWIQVLVRKSRLVFRDNIEQLINKGIVRHEKRYFLNIIPYNRYFIYDPDIRSKLIVELREILLNGKAADKRQSMMIGLIKASESYRILSESREERRIIKRKCGEFVASDIVATETAEAIRQVQIAMTAAVAASTVAAHR